jgi:hypothetical protein
MRRTSRMPRNVAATLCAAAFTFAAISAYAQSAPDPTPPTTTPDRGSPATPPQAPIYNIYVVASPAAPSEAPKEFVSPSDHHHEGFLLRMGLGAGYFHDSQKVTESGVGGDATISSMGVGIDLAIGGSLSPGLVLGGALLTNTAVEPKVDYGDPGGPSAARVNALILGPFIDYYTRPNGGLHFGGTIGFTAVAIRDRTSPIRAETVRGVAIVPEIGYEWWVGSEWAVGGMLRVVLERATGSRRDVTESDGIAAPSLMLTATFN